MYDIKWIRENAEVFDRGRKRRGLEPLAEKLLALDDKRRAAIAKSQAAQERRNAASKEIGAAMKAGDASLAKALKIEVGDLKTALPEYEAKEREAIKELDEALAKEPNTPLDEVPDGRDENDNVELRRVGEPPHFNFEPKEHFDIGEALGLMDFETATKISGARFVVLKGALARLERALSQFMLDLHTSEHGYTEVSPPILVRDEAMFGTAQLPKFENDQFFALKCGYWCELTRSESLRGEEDDLRCFETLGYEGMFQYFIDLLESDRLSAHPHRRSAPHQSHARKNPRRKGTAPPLHRLHAVLSRRGGRGGQGHTRNDPPASIHKGRTCLHHHARSFACRARPHAFMRRGSA